MYRTVTYELLSLEAWLTTGKRLNPALQTKIRTEILRVREALLEGVISLSVDTHVQRYVRTHLFGVIQLLNKSFERKSLETHALLSELLNVIESNFSAYLDSDAEICHSHRVELIRQCREMTVTLHNAFEKFHVSKELELPYSDVFKSAMNRRAMTYGQRTYLLALIQELSNSLAETTQNSLEVVLGNMLLQFDLNTASAINYWETRISAKVNSVELRLEKREVFIAFQRSLNSVSVVQAHYSYAYPSLTLRDQVLNYIDREINRLQRPSLTLARETTEDVMPDTFRVRTELSVSQLACFVKSLVDSSIIVNPNVSELLRLLSKIIISKRTELISFDSLRAKYYNIESGTKESVRQYLRLLLQRVGDK